MDNDKNINRMTYLMIYKFTSDKENENINENDN